MKLYHLHRRYLILTSLLLAVVSNLFTAEAEVITLTPDTFNDKVIIASPQTTLISITTRSQPTCVLFVFLIIQQLFLLLNEREPLKSLLLVLCFKDLGLYGFSWILNQVAIKPCTNYL